MSEERIAALEGSLRAVTDQVGRLMDQITGKGLVPAFRCGHSRMFFPGDYVKEWGRKYGWGLGGSPVSECLDSDYEAAPPPITPETRSLELIMHPVEVTKAQVDLVLVTPEEFEAGRLVLAAEDPYMTRRAQLLRERQLQNPRSRLGWLLAAAKKEIR